MSKRPRTNGAAAPLESRIAAALAGPVTSAVLAALVRETEMAIGAADKDAKEARERALDPVASPDPTKAREAMEAAEFARDRLKTVFPRLQSCFDKVSAQETYDAWIVEYERVKQFRDAAADELKAIYLPFLAAMTDLLLKVEIIDAEVRRINAAKPYHAAAANGDGRHLREVELEARGLESLGHTLSILKDMRLPKWERAELPAWPPHRPATHFIAAGCSFDGRPRREY
jgi:hypothetical protein